MKEGSFINGYILKNIMYQNEFYELYDTVDKNGNSYVLKRIMKENHENNNNNTNKTNETTENNKNNRIESFQYGSTTVLIYPICDFNDEGTDYFSYNLNFPDKEDMSLKSILTQRCSNKDKNITICIDNQSTSHKNSKLEKNIHLHSCKGRVRTPLPKAIFMSTEDEDEDEIEDEEEVEEDEGDEVEISSSGKFLNINYCTAKELNIPFDGCLKPILIHDNFNATNETMRTSANIHNDTHNGKNMPSSNHVQIASPAKRVIHTEHRFIRKTPVPNTMALNKSFTSSDSITTRRLQKQWEEQQYLDQNMRFDLKMVQSSMLKRRSLPKCGLSN